MTSLATISSWFTNNQVLLENILIYGLLAFSVQVALRTGIFSLAGIGFYAIGSYTAALLVKDGWPAVFAVLAALALTAIIGYLLAVLLVRLRDLYLAMATFAFDLMVGVIALNWGGLTGGALGVNLIPVLVSLLGLILITIGVVVLLTVTRAARSAARSSPCARTSSWRSASPSTPVATAASRSSSRACSGAWPARCMTFIFNVIQAQDAGFNLIVLALTMVILGGFGSWVGAALGAFLLTWIPIRLTSVGVRWPVYYGGATVLVATFAPGGLIGIARKGVRAALNLRDRRPRPRR